MFRTSIPFGFNPLSRSLLGNNQQVTTSIDLNFIKFAIESILEIKKYDIHQIKHIIDELIKRQLKYSNYYDKLDEICINVILKDPFFFLIHYSYLICDLQYVQIILKRSLESAIQTNIDLIKKQHEEQKALTGYRATNEIGIKLDASIKSEYIYYVAFYGFPPDRIFLPSILERIKYGIINEENYKLFNPYNDNLSHLILHSDDSSSDKCSSKSSSSDSSSNSPKSNSSTHSPKSNSSSSPKSSPSNSSSPHSSICTPTNNYVIFIIIE